MNFYNVSCRVLWEGEPLVRSAKRLERSLKRKRVGERRFTRCERRSRRVTDGETSGQADSSLMTGPRDAVWWYPGDQGARASELAEATPVLVDFLLRNTYWRGRERSLTSITAPVVTSPVAVVSPHGAAPIVGAPAPPSAPSGAGPPIVPAAFVPAATVPAVLPPAVPAAPQLTSVLVHTEMYDEVPVVASVSAPRRAPILPPQSEGVVGRLLYIERPSLVWTADEDHSDGWAVQEEAPDIRRMGVRPGRTSAQKRADAYRLYHPDYQGR